MNSVAQREETTELYLATGTDGSSALQQIAAERLAAHRSKRAAGESRAAQAQRNQVAAMQAAVRLQARREAVADRAASTPGSTPDAARVREAVAARYLQSQSYREFLAAEAQRALEQAQAEAEVAARSARAVVAAQQQLLDEIAQWNEPAADAEKLPVLEIVERKTKRPAVQVVAMQAAIAPMQLQVKMHEELTPGASMPVHHVSTKTAMAEPEELDDLADLDEEIEFRRAPEFEPLDLVTQTIPANILEFPRELVAARKVRPRLAEGPLFEEVVPEPQLRIFEVEPEQVASEPEVAALPDAAEWQSLRLGSETAAQRQEQSFAHLESALGMDHAIYAASVWRRMMSVAVDGLVLVSALAGAAEIAMKIAGPMLQSEPVLLLAGSAAGTLAVFAVIYRLLFFTLNDATPGMRATRIAFCTFEEQSPKRKFMRRRVMATLLAASPLGMGLLWTVLDADGLGWHDRMSRMYPRKY